MLNKKITDNVRFVFKNDPAINAEHAELNYEEFLENYDWKYLSFNDGQNPTVFVVGKIKLKQRIFIHSVEDVFKRAYWAVRFGLTGVENYDIDAPTKASYGEFGEILTDDWLDKLDLSTNELLLLGSVIIKINEVRSPLS